MCKTFGISLFFIVVFACFTGCSKDKEIEQKLAPQYFNGKLLQMIHGDSLNHFSFFEYYDDGRLSRIYKVSLYESFCIDYKRKKIELGGTMLSVPFTLTSGGYLKTLEGSWKTGIFDATVDYNINYNSGGYLTDATFFDIGFLSQTGYSYSGASQQEWDDGNLKKVTLNYSTTWKKGDTIMSVNSDYVLEYTYTDIENKWLQNTKLTVLATDIIGYSGFAFTGYLGKGPAKLPKSCVLKTLIEVVYNGESHYFSLKDVTTRAEYLLNEDGTIKLEKLYSYPSVDLDALVARKSLDMEWNTSDDKLEYLYE